MDGSSPPSLSNKREPTESQSTQETKSTQTEPTSPFFLSADMTRPFRRTPKRPISGNKNRGMQLTCTVCLRRGPASENPVSTHCGGGGRVGGAAGRETVHSGGRTKETPSRIRRVGEGVFGFGFWCGFFGGYVGLERGAVWGRVGWDLVHGCGMCLEMAGM